MKMKYDPVYRPYSIRYENLDPSWTKSKIVSIVLALAGMAVAAIFLVLEFDRRIGLAAGGFGLMMFGVYVMKITVCDYPEERFYSSFVFVIGALTLIVSLFSLLSEKLNVSQSDAFDLLKLRLFSVAVLVCNLFGIIYEKVLEHLKKSRCTECVTATCIDIAETGAGRGRMFVHIWEYTTADGLFTYTTPESRQYISKKNRIGDIKDIFVNPDDPEDIFVKRFHRRMIVYVLFTLIGALMTAMVFMP